MSEVSPAEQDRRTDVGPGADDRSLHLFQPIRPRKVVDEVVFAIVNAIRGDIYAPGDLLPRERDLSDRLQVSRTTVREAFRILERAGIVSVRRGNKGGAVVLTRAISPSVLEHSEESPWANMRALLQARRVLETTCAILSAQNATEEDLEQLERLVERLPALRDDPQEFIAVDLQWHRKVGYASGNEVLGQCLDQTLRAFSALARKLPRGYIDLDEGVANQRDTLEAIRSGDRKRVEASIDRHLGSVEEHLLVSRIPPLHGPLLT
jgi:GntR family transcriptional repressor for pyruvate dehydrogenase complex